MRGAPLFEPCEFVFAVVGVECYRDRSTEKEGESCRAKV